MAQDSLELVRSIYEGWGQGDFSRYDWAHPEIEFEYVGGPEPTSWKGIEAMDAGWREWLRSWVGFRAEPLEYRVLGEDRILVLVRNRARGRQSGLELEQRSVGNYFELEEGLVTRLVIYLDGGRALSEHGLDG
jgi:ketosteroid isomerase-like protein